MNIITFLMGIFTALLIGAQFNNHIPLPACWGIWGIVVIIGLLIIMIKNNSNPRIRIEDEEEEKKDN